MRVKSEKTEVKKAESTHTTPIGKKTRIMGFFYTANAPQVGHRGAIDRFNSC